MSKEPKYESKHMPSSGPLGNVIKSDDEYKLIVSSKDLTKVLSRNKDVRIEVIVNVYDKETDEHLIDEIITYDNYKLPKLK